MQGLMQDWPLTVDRILDHAATWRPQGEIFTAAARGAPSRTTYGQLGARVRRLASALAVLGVRRGDVVGVIGANTTRQLEAWYAVIGMGAICHPLNPELTEDRMASLLTLAGDKLVFVDPALLPAVEGVLRRSPAIEHVVALGEEGQFPQTSLPDVIAHETLIRRAGAIAAWGGAEEGAPAVLVHTAGASGEAKGVVWTHRSCVLQALIGQGPDGLDLSSRETVLPLVPFWRAAGWGLVFCGPLSGAKLVFAGTQTDPQSMRVLVDREAVSLAVASAADLQVLHDQFRGEDRRPNRLMRVIAAGGLCPPALAKSWRDGFGVEAKSAWGLTETSALGGIADPTLGDMRPPFGLELEIVDASGQAAPHDGVAIGRLRARGAVVAGGYFAEARTAASDGFLDTGDLASIDPEGRLRVMGRATNVVAAGEDLVQARRIEDAALEHPATAEAAVIAAPAGYGVSGPLLIVHRRPGESAGKADYLRFLGDRVGFAAAPTEVLFVDALPHDPSGRVDKTVLREKLERLVPPAPEPQPEPIAAGPEPIAAAGPWPSPDAAHLAAAVAIPALLTAGDVIYEPPSAPESHRAGSDEPQPLIELEGADQEAPEPWDGEPEAGKAEAGEPEDLADEAPEAEAPQPGIAEPGPEAAEAIEMLREVPDDSVESGSEPATLAVDEEVEPPAETAPEQPAATESSDASEPSEQPALLEEPTPAPPAFGPDPDEAHASPAGAEEPPRAEIADEVCAGPPRLDEATPMEPAEPSSEEAEPSSEEAEASASETSSPSTPEAPDLPASEAADASDPPPAPIEGADEPRDEAGVAAGPDGGEPAAAVAEAAPAAARIEEPEHLAFVRLEPRQPRRGRRMERKRKPAAAAMSPARMFLSFTAALAVLPPLIILAGALGARTGLADWRYGLHELLLDWPYKIALVGTVGGVLALFVGLNLGLRRVWRRVALSLALPLAVLMALTGMRVYSARFPPLHDVSTDWTDPVTLSPALIQARGPSANPVENDPIVPSGAGAYMNRRVAEVNAETCPAAQPVILQIPADQAYTRARTAVLAEGLQLATDDPSEGKVEAVASGTWLGFQDDVAIRIKVDPKGSRLDLRSVSRQGLNDMGANCRRVTRLIAAIQGGG